MNKEDIKNSHYAKEAYNKLKDMHGERGASIKIGEALREFGGRSGLDLIGQGRAKEVNRIIDQYRGKKK